jgi:cell division inhibitor SulA
MVQLGSFVLRTSDIAWEDPTASGLTSTVTYDNEIGMMNPTGSDFRFRDIPYAEIVGRVAFEKHKTVLIRCQQYGLYYAAAQSSKNDQVWAVTVSGHSPIRPEWVSGAGLSRSSVLCFKKDDNLSTCTTPDDKSITYLDLVCAPQATMTLRFRYTSMVSIGGSPPLQPLIAPITSYPHAYLAFTIHSID